MNFNTSKILATDIPDAWFQCLYEVLSKGFRHIVEQGSVVGQTRCELDWIEIVIRHPYQVDTEGSYNPMIPVIPESMKNIPAPLTLEGLYDYIPYILSSEQQPNEQYTYGNRMFDDPFDQGGIAIDLFLKTPNTNQAILQVARPEDCALEDPPCLRHIDMRAKDGFLIFYPYFRSWDLWAGLPANLAAIAVLQDHIAQHSNLKVGPMLATSKGLHLYGYAEKLAELRTGIILRKS